MRHTIGGLVLGLSACGYPLTQFAVGRCGTQGAAAAETVCAGLASGIPARLHPIPAALLRRELAAATDAARRAAVATLSAAHTLRFAIYLRPDRDSRAALAPDVSRAAAEDAGPAPQ